MDDVLQKANSILNTNYTTWCALSEHKSLSDDFIREFKDDLYWFPISAYQQLSEDFIREFKDKVDWYYISVFQRLSKDFIREFKDNVEWGVISVFQHLSEDFIREFKDNVEWRRISKYQHLSEDFIREFKYNVYWYDISAYQHLSEDFIREFKDCVNWCYISKYQQLSEDFIREFKDKVDWDVIRRHQYLSDDFCKEFNIIRNDDSWLYNDVKYKKQQVIDSGLYECYDDYFIAYKGIRCDRYSKYNFQYQYLPGQIYESWCDCTNDEDSFGLSVWTEENAKEYCNECVVKVKVRYEDVGRMVHDNGKIRCFKIEVLD